MKMPKSIVNWKGPNVHIQNGAPMSTHIKQCRYELPITDLNSPANERKL